MATEKVTYADYVKPKRYIDWTSPIWQERLYIANENAIADAYEALLEKIVEFADDWWFTHYDESRCDRLRNLPSIATLSEFIDDAIEDVNETLETPLASKLMRRVKQELRHDIFNVYNCDVWRAYATLLGTTE